MSGLLTERQASIAKLRGLGLSQAEIATSLEITSESVKTTLEAIYARKIDENLIVMARVVELDRLEKMHQAYEAAALALNKDAAMVCLAVHDRKSKIVGLEAPKRAADLLGPNVTFNLNFLGDRGGQSLEPAIVGADQAESPGVIEGEVIDVN